MLHNREYIIKCLKIKYIFIFKVVYNPGWGFKNCLDPKRSVLGSDCFLLRLCRGKKLFKIETLSFGFKVVYNPRRGCKIEIFFLKKSKA